MLAILVLALLAGLALAGWAAASRPERVVALVSSRGRLRYRSEALIARGVIVLIGFGAIVALVITVGSLSE